MDISLPDDFMDMLLCLLENKVDFIIVGGYAMALNGYIRATGDIDIFVNPTKENSTLVYNALVDFGAPLNSLKPDDFSIPGTVFQMGVPPLRIDIINKIDGVTFEMAASNAEYEEIQKYSIPYLNLDLLIANKEKTGRNKDKLDAVELRNLKDSKNG